MVKKIAGVDIGNDSMKYYDGIQGNMSIMPNVIANIFKIPELRKRVIFTLFSIVV